MNHSIKPINSERGQLGRAGFSLIEITVAMALAAILLGGIFQVAGACFEVSSSVTESSQQEMHVAAFFGLLRRNFTAMPGNGKLTMEVPNAVGSSGYNTEIVLKDYPLAFSWGGVAAGSDRVLIVSEKDPLGGTQIRIRYLNEELSEEHESGGLDPDAGQSLVLIAGIKTMYWRFFDQTEEEWVEEWEEEARRPSLVELNVEFFSQAEPVRAVFWIPVVANPESVVRGAQTSPGAGGGGGGRPDAGGGVQLPGGGRGPGGGGAAGGRDFNNRGGGGAPGGGRPGGGTGGGRPQGGGGGRGPQGPGGGR